MILSLLFTFATMVNACFFFWYYHKSKKQKAGLNQWSIPASELHLLKTALQIERKERHRIANVLHHKSSSTLAAVRMYLSAVHSSKKPAVSNSSFEGVHSLLESAYVEINKSLYSLKPEMALDNGLDEAIRKYCSHLATQKLLSVEYDSWGVARRYHDAFELSVFRFVQILMNYILQQGSATFAIVQMGMRNDALTIAVEDNGKGYQSVEDLLEDPFFSHLDQSIHAINGQMEVRTDNGLSVFIQLDTAAFARAEAFLVA